MIDGLMLMQHMFWHIYDEEKIYKRFIIYFKAAFDTLSWSDEGSLSYCIRIQQNSMIFLHFIPKSFLSREIMNLSLIIICLKCRSFGSFLKEIAQSPFSFCHIHPQNALISSQRNVNTCSKSLKNVGISIRNNPFPSFIPIKRKVIVRTCKINFFLFPQYRYKRFGLFQRLIFASNSRNDHRQSFREKLEFYVPTES